jgi:hypothetical protein
MTDTFQKSTILKRLAQDIKSPERSDFQELFQGGMLQNRQIVETLVSAKVSKKFCPIVPEWRSLSDQKIRKPGDRIRPQTVKHGLDLLSRTKEDEYELSGTKRLKCPADLTPQVVPADQCPDSETQGIAPFL